MKNINFIYSTDFFKKNDFFRNQVHGTVIVGKLKPNQKFGLSCFEVDRDNCRKFQGGIKIGKKKSIQRHQSIYLFEILY